MAVVEPLGEDEMEPGLRAEVQFFKGPLGVVPNSVRTMAHRPEIARAFTALNVAVMTCHGAVSQAISPIMPTLFTGAEIWPKPAWTDLLPASAGISTPYDRSIGLMKSPGRIFTKVQIYENINGEYFENDDNTMMVHISKLRDKLEEDPRNPRYIKTVRGLGYKIESKN